MQTPHNSCYLVFEKMSKTHFGKKKDSTVNKQYWETWISTRSTMKPDPIFHRNVTLNSKWIKALKTRPDTMKVHEIINLVSMEVHDGSDVYKAGIQMFMMDDANMESSISRVHKRQGLFPEFKPVSRPFSFYFLDRTYILSIREIVILKSPI
ncbi:hypothetical protein H671_1g2513 [Cricetulus griseus]|nr:hypothetical protein H671_1g2513 [Cricetulus griseus]